jgi:hypothetical protein
MASRFFKHLIGRYEAWDLDHHVTEIRRGNTKKDYSVRNGMEIKIPLKDRELRGVDLIAALRVSSY